MERTNPKRRRVSQSPERRTERGEPINVLGDSYSDEDEAGGSDRGNSRGGGKVKAPEPKKMTYKLSEKYRSKMIKERFGYSSESNPFGDPNLGAPFVWKKKEQQLKAAGQYTKPTKTKFLDQTKRKISEIESVKKRREERELEETMLEEQKALMAREKEQENYDEWVEKEEEFHREMAQKRIDIRIEQGRERPVDLLAKAVKILGGFEFEDLSLLEYPPHEIFNDMGTAELEEIMEDIRAQLPADLSLVAQTDESDDDSEDGRKTNRDNNVSRRFWRAMMVMAKDALEKSVKAELELERRTAASSAALNASTAATSLALAGLPPPTSTANFSAPMAGGDALGAAPLLRDEQTGIPLTVSQEIDRLLAGKSVVDLQVLEMQLENKLRRGEGDDVTYWEAIQERIPFYKARAECSEIYDRAKDKVHLMRNARREEKRQAATAPSSTDWASPDVQPENTDVVVHGAASQQAQSAWDEFDEQNTAGQGGEYSPLLEPYEDPQEASEASAAHQVPSPPHVVPGKGSGPYSPILRPLREFVHCLADVVDPVEDRQRRDKLKTLFIEKARQMKAALESSAWPSTSASGAGQPDIGFDPKQFDIFDKFIHDERKANHPDEINLGLRSELALQRQHYDWEDKYRPRKPRFFNRVKTGYEWNKYNQTHYDHDNPPPKAVQGYKFNIFYPDLIDKSKTPTWTLEPCGSAGDTDDDDDAGTTCIIRFHAGPPYEDVAFKIINRQWELNARRGYRNCFDRGILQLYFNFTRYRYRR